jgi:hypothetical protein
MGGKWMGVKVVDHEVENLGMQKILPTALGFCLTWPTKLNQVTWNTDRPLRLAGLGMPRCAFSHDYS